MASREDLDTSFPDFNQIWLFSTVFHISSQCQISRKFVQAGA